MQTKEQLIKKLYHNQCSKSELYVLLELIEKDDNEIGPEVMLLLLQQIENAPKLDMDTTNRIFSDVIKRSSNQPGDPIPRKLSFHKRYHLLINTAAVALLLIGSWFVFQPRPISEIVTQTNYGERTEINLPDGSLVTLNGNTKITYPSKWAKGATRIVKLQGEAFFEVQKKPSTNVGFRVITEDLTVVVLGTSFNVNTRHETTRVYLDEGKVKLKLQDNSAKEVFMNPGELASYSLKKNLLQQPHRSTKELQISWQQGIISFKDATLSTILEKLTETNNFEYEIVGVELELRKFTISLPNDNMELAMSLLNKTSNTTSIRRNNKYYISPKKE